MANTEGLSDEAVSSLLTLPPSSQPAGRMTSSSRLARREKMMELGDGETPAATVIRSSIKAPTVVRGSTKKSHERSSSAEKNTMDQCVSNSDEAPIIEDMHNAIDDLSSIHKPVIMSTYIRERSLCATELNESIASTKSRVSRFKQRNNELRTPTAGGFPSLDIAPMGTFTRKGRMTSSRAEPLPAPIDVVQKSTHHPPNAFNNLGQASDSLLANMSTEEIREGVEEITSILSSKSIEFLKRRGKQKLVTSNESSFRGAMQDDKIGRAHV